MFDLVSTLIGAGAKPSPASRAFVVNYLDHSITALNVSNSASISFTSELTDATNLASPVDLDLDVTGRIAWVIGLGNQITAVNIANPASMAVLGSYSSGGFLPTPRAVKLDKARNRAFVLCHSNATLTSINTATATAPTLVQGIVTASGYSGAHNGLALDLTNNVAHILATSSTGVQVVTVDISNPAAMTVLDRVNLTGSDATLGGLALSNDLTKVFASYGAGDFSVVDVSTPTATTELYNFTNLFTLGGPGKVSCLPDNIVLVCASLDDAMKTLDVSNPASITVLDTESGTTYLDEARGHAVDRYNGTIFVCGTNGDDFSSYTRSGGTMTFLNNYTSGTNINGPYAVALI